MQREAVRTGLASCEGFVSAGQLHDLLTGQGVSVGLATVYRQLNSLAESGQADTIPVAGGQLFRSCTPGSHHHHLICEGCGLAVEIDPPDEAWIERAAQRRGFTVTRHLFEVFGRCRECPEHVGDVLEGSTSDDS
ncbi:transcriptional repressor [Microbacterium sediminicola]|uniref:Transcriptional repressor n=1 Tax=Microbacterium sediminicola TaxID=415210 RepID=A0ABP4TZC9_9MICO